ncbi:MAG: hypothetical protein U9O89_06795 [Thermoproteota archaeon]|nr:hypothetical protein [Thermoproteota archaeon]
MVKRTTVLLRDDIYEAVKVRAGPKNMSKLINEILVKYLIKGESMFGTMPKVDISDLRDHRDRL